MKNMKYARTLLTLALVLVVLGSIVGGTIAWFTDEVESAGNLIKSGTLDMQVFTTDETGTEVELTDGSAPLFDYKYWEPGYVAYKPLTIKNAGDLAFKYELKVKPSVTEDQTTEYNLADVIDVYVLDAATEVTREAVAAAAPVGTITDLTGDNAAAAFAGVLLPAEGKGSTDVNEDETATRGETAVNLVLKMQESAGNEYQNLQIGDGFSIELIATQYTWENDSFDHEYDSEVDFTDPELPKAKVTKLSAEETAKIEAITYTEPSNEKRYLDVAYHFETTETYEEAQQNPYAKWHADYVVTVDKHVTGRAGIAGQYGSYDYLAFDAGEVGLKAGEEFRLLMDFAGLTMNYEELCLFVEDFYCGAYDMDGTATGATLTVELRLYETKDPADTADNTANEETGKFITINTQKYTFK